MLLLDTSIIPSRLTTPVILRGACPFTPHNIHQQSALVNLLYWLILQRPDALMDTISIKGARTHNLKNFDLDIPRDKLIVITGLSGSGKSSLAFDTLYAEGQRRYVESLSTYARQFLSMMEKPDIDHIEGLSPAISIEQKSTSHNPRSTVGTITEILRLSAAVIRPYRHTPLPRPRPRT